MGCIGKAVGKLGWEEKVRSAKLQVMVEVLDDVVQSCACLHTSICLWFIGKMIDCQSAKSSVAFREIGFSLLQMRATLHVFL